VIVRAILWVVVPAALTGAVVGMALGMWGYAMGALTRGLIVGTSVGIVMALGQWRLSRKPRA
jgi:hypothetical protein